MRFSANGYYVERYIKCANCGVLVYGPGLTAMHGAREVTFCSPWCIEWLAFRENDAAETPPPMPRTQR
jgi:N-methylhydantoinase B